jgi:hypothetical protein
MEADVRVIAEELLKALDEAWESVKPHVMKYYH